MNKKSVLPNNYTKTSFFCSLLERVTSFLDTSIKESFFHKTIRDMAKITGSIKSIYFGLFILVVTLGHTKDFFGSYVVGLISFRPFFYTMMFIGILFLVTPLKLDEIACGSLLFNMFRSRKCAE